jgi:NAD(P)H-hydrate epimerase
MRRLWPDAAGLRAEIARGFSTRHGVTLLLKGARTVVATPGQPLAFNSTGSPGMATGGMGDVLTGVCAALLARGLSTHDAARAGAWLCGRAAELALLAGHSEESLAASDVIAHIGRAFAALRQNCF